MPVPSVAFPAVRIQKTVDAELRERFERVAARGAFRLGVPIDPSLLDRAAALAPKTPIIPRTPAAVEAAPAPAPAPRVPVEATPTAPAPPPVRIARRAVSLGAMEEPMQRTYSDWQMGAMTIDPTVLRQYIRPQRVAATPVAAPTSYVGGYPVVREEDKADWTTYAMIGAALLVVGGGVYYAKKKRMF